MSRISKLLQRVWSLFVYMVKPIDEAFWKEILDDAEREYRRGNTNFFAIALMSGAYDKWVHERIIQMLFLPDIQKPEWLQFEHVLNGNTPEKVLQFAVSLFNDLQMSLQSGLKNENVYKLRALLLNRMKPQMQAA